MDPHPPSITYLNFHPGPSLDILPRRRPPFVRDSRVSLKFVALVGFFIFVKRGDFLPVVQ